VQKETYPVLNPSNIIISEEELQTILSNFGINIPIKILIYGEEYLFINHIVKM